MNKKFLYISIPKTAGVSIHNSGLVNPEDWANHNFARNIKNLKEFFSFSFIRNPYEKILSSYFYYQTKLDRDWFKEAYKNYPTFKLFIMDFEVSRHSDWRHYKTPSYEYVTDGNGKILVDYIGSFDNIEEEFKKVQLMNGVESENLKELPKLNVSKHDFWKNYYDDEMAEIVYHHLKIDFDFFNFSKNSYKI